MTLASICLGLSLIAAMPASDPVAPPDPALSYRELREKAGRSPEDQVRLALWCEAHNLPAERLHHLTLAVLADPRNAIARSLMGLVARDGRWLRPEAVADKLKADPERSATLAEYEQKRQKAAYTAEAQWALGVWAEEHGLAEQAKAHLTTVTRLDPAREEAWKRLGYKKHDGRWVTDAQHAREKSEAEAQKLADRKWKPLLEKQKAMLDQPSKREAADAALAEVTDPRAVPSIMHAFGTSRAADQLRAVQLLGQVESPSASRSLAGLAVLSPSADVRRAALETLKGRDPRDFVRLWVALVRRPIRFEVQNVGGPGSPGSLLVEGERANYRRIYMPPAMPNVPVLAGTRMGFDANGLPVLSEPIGREDIGLFSIVVPNVRYDASQVRDAITKAAHGGNLQQILRDQAKSGHPAQTITGSSAFAFGQSPEELNDVAMLSNLAPFNRSRLTREIDLQVPIGQMMVDANRAAQSSQQQLDADVARLEATNTSARRSNEPTLQALKAITGKDFGDDPVAWSRWWTENQGYAFAITQADTRPTVVEQVTPDYVPQAVPQVVAGPLAVAAPHHSCFAAGTAVRTIDGERPVETIRAGDLVLTEDTTTGSLGYRAVVTAFHNPPSATLRIKLGEADAVVATGIHRFWKVGKGWTMARDLKPGDLVRTLGGVATVSAVEPDRVQPVFNLEVAEGNSFLVGKLGALVHDNSLVEATPAPFDAAPAVAAVKAPK